MRVVERPTTAAAFARAAADIVAAQLQRKPQSVLALPTGNTPLGLYAELAQRASCAALDMSGSFVFNLDEYVGLSSQDPHSYAAFLQLRLIAPLGLGGDQVRLLRGNAPDLERECAAYDAAIADRGGLDLCVLGLGVNGHVAFNEPGADWNLTTHVTRLSSATRAAHERQAFTPWPIPVWGVTMGIRSILEARSILLLIAGDGKEGAKEALYRGKPDRDFPVTCLADHPGLTIIELCAPEGSRPVPPPQRKSLARFRA